RHFCYHRSMDAETNLFAIARLVGEPARGAILSALLDGRVLPASELAYRAGVSPQTASAHLARLIEGGLLRVERTGRHRYYRLADPEVAQRLEALATVLPFDPARTPRQGRVPERLREARTCYDHLAGRLGVALTESLVANDLLLPEPTAFTLTELGARRLESLGVDLDAARRQRRRFARRC